MNLDELPGGIRLKLKQKDEKQLWLKAEQKGLKDVAEKTGFKPHNVYSWRNENSYLPKTFVEHFLQDPEVEAVKGNGRSKPTRNLEIDDTSDELLTRVDESVSVNIEGVPIYQQSDRGCVKRFIELLERVGDVPYSVYDRELYEVRYPKYVQDIFDSKDFETLLAAKVDESGSIANGKIRLEDRVIDVDEFSGQLYSRDKKLQLAIEREDSKEIEKLMAVEAARIREAFE